MRLGEGQEGIKITGTLLCNWGKWGLGDTKTTKKGRTGNSLLHCLQVLHPSLQFSLSHVTPLESAPSVLPSGHCTGYDLNISHSYTYPDFLSGSPHRPLSDINPSNHIKTQNRPCLLLFKSLPWFPITYNKMPWTEVPRNLKNVRANWRENKHDSFAYSSDTLVDLWGFLFFFYFLVNHNIRNKKYM